MSCTPVSPAVQHVSLFVDGVMSDSDSALQLEVTNPSNGRQIYALPRGCQADVHRAVVSGRQAFERGDWSRCGAGVRKRALHRWADLIAADAADLDALDAEEMGKPISTARFNAVAASELVRFYAEAVDKVSGDTFTSDERTLVIQRRAPRGVVAAVTPWNFPTYNAVLKVAPAIAAGNAVVLKPSELASRSAARLAGLAMEADVPPGIFNLTPGAGQTVGQALALHGDVDMVTFTGSTAVGKAMLQYSAHSNMKTVLAECGGKSPHIVFGDGVDLGGAADGIAQMILTNQGQICSVGSRVLVERRVEAELVELLSERMQGAVIGDALDRSTTFGPLASEGQFQKVRDYIDGAAEEGAELVTGGRTCRPESGGYFIEPTLFRDVRPSARIAREEIFGPVLAVIAFDDEAEAIRLANGTPYGLAAYAWTRDLSRGMRLAKSVRGSVRVNAAAPAGEGAGYAASFEPVGQSGLGVEGGLGGMESYLQRELMWFNHG